MPRVCCAQLSEYVDELGKMPALSRYSARAVFVASLLNPPACGPHRVTHEFRSSVLGAETALMRLHIAKMALCDSIARLKAAEKGAPLFDLENP